jgi:hypothetical protein
MKSLAPILVLLLAAESVHADMGFDIPGKHRAHVTVRITTQEPLDDFVVLVLNEHPLHDEPRAMFAELSPSNPLLITGFHHSVRRELYLVQKADLKGASAEQAYDAIKANRMPVAFHASLSFDESVPEWYADDFVVVHRLEHDAGRFKLVRITQSPLWQCGVICLAVPVGIILFGLWFSRQIRPKKPG